MAAVVVKIGVTE